MSKDSVNVKVDDRERSEAVFRTLAAMEGVAVQTGRLPLGDYRVDDDLLFERKTLNDFAISLIDGRLFRQMARLAASPLQGILIREGTGADLRAAGVRRDALQGALKTIGLIFGIPVLRAMDGGESARLIVFAARRKGFVKAGGAGPRERSRGSCISSRGCPASDRPCPDVFWTASAMCAGC